MITELRYYILALVAAGITPGCLLGERVVTPCALVGSDLSLQMGESLLNDHRVFDAGDNLHCSTTLTTGLVHRTALYFNLRRG